MLIFVSSYQCVLRSVLAQRFQRAALRDNLIEHRVDGLLVMGSRLEDAEVFKVGKHGEQDLVAHRRDLHLGQRQAQLLDCARPACTPVADEASRLVVPLAEEKINRVLERAGDAMIVLGRDEDNRRAPSNNRNVNCELLQRA